MYKRSLVAEPFYFSPCHCMAICEENFRRPPGGNMGLTSISFLVSPCVDADPKRLIVIELDVHCIQTGTRRL